LLRLTLVVGIGNPLIGKSSGINGDIINDAIEVAVWTTVNVIGIPGGRGKVGVMYCFGC